MCIRDRIVRDVGKNIFWPPAKDFVYDEFQDLLGFGQFEALMQLEGES